ncbi:hypothetical protein RchiOBHm_Chr4g0388441 [Rosa chinensis]|uniref:Uncharacterized protein n=1 Tax=Rosa chinensis TaxID=74649 RepID=A0A2P6QPS7_ROSCH|nr:hypothetical protein RchiOBHm_Chr4g0388441 [Rosa chinensis]
MSVVIALCSIKIVRFFYVGGRLEAALAEHEISGYGMQTFALTIWQYNYIINLSWGTYQWFKTDAS